MSIRENQADIPPLPFDHLPDKGLEPFQKTAFILRVKYEFVLNNLTAQMHICSSIWP